MQMPISQRGRAFRLYPEERIFLNMVLEKAVAKVQMKDMKLCVACALDLYQIDLEDHKRGDAFLRDVVQNAIRDNGTRVFQRLMYRLPAYVQLPPILRGKGLVHTAELLALPQRTKFVRVDRGTLKEEVMMAAGRTKMKMAEETGRECRRVIMLKTKRLRCIKKIVKEAQKTGVADITLVWRDFHHTKNIMLEVSLEAIAKVARLTNVYVLDIHTLTYLFPYHIFLKVMNLLNNSYIFAINMGEDDGIFEYKHFALIASKIEDGSSAIRRWFVEIHGNRRDTVIRSGLISKVHTKVKGPVPHPNVFTKARRTDILLWGKGRRDEPRMSWLRAPDYAYDAAIKFKADMQNEQCNWVKACYWRAKAQVPMLQFQAIPELATIKLLTGNSTL